MVQVLLDFVKYAPLLPWDLHLQSNERILVWIHAYNRINYSRHFTYYSASQQKLATKHPSKFYADNKIDLINFVLREWSTNENHILVLEGNDIYMTI